ncbi:CAP domain-containing protein [Chlorogloeopsis sp. ULAP01]|uniref:CAP domain-containing protein n=1 Tax=Chlorogloeopsis sp. ULAP01 TaxID=3056483 RepID=UPI0025AB29B0|nr:CAP domain-containing protein [Chlorogloeopsis sp. ULAP01]MDM9384802.1 CAP domain-containing protein [Chlorogloeopsis sp. ULAP01]
MMRQSAFGIALGVLCITSGLTTAYALSLTSALKNSALSCQISLPASFQTTDVEKSVFNQINNYRVSVGLPKLTLDEKMTEQARIHSQNMANGKVPFSHEGFERRVNAIATHYKSAAENLAFNRGYSDPATEAIDSWLNSSKHLPNIKGDYNFTGVGVAVNSKGEVYLTQIFLNDRGFETNRHK